MLWRERRSINPAEPAGQRDEAENRRGVVVLPRWLAERTGFFASGARERDRARPPVAIVRRFKGNPVEKLRAITAVVA